MRTSLVCLTLALVLGAGPAWAAALQPGQVDRVLAAEWQRRGVRPAAPVDDAGFIRRAYLDLTGVIPPPEAVTAFLADRGPAKRAQLIDGLLGSPRYAEHFTDYWEAVLFGRGNKNRRQEIDRDAWRAWLRERLGQDTPWDRLVYEQVTASGTNSVGDPQAAAPPVAPRPVNGAVNFLLLFERNPQDLGGVLSREFLGVQIQCAQCHNHPTERWKQDDFRRFVAAFARMRVERVDKDKVMKVRRMEVYDQPRPIGGGPNEVELREIAKATATALDGADLSADPEGPRHAAAAWMVSPQNPWFARELVNRYWAYLVGRGFFEPIDDMRPSNPATLPALLDLLTRDFIASGYDLKHLIRLICATRAYQLSAGPARDRDLEFKLWSRCRLRPMGPSELFDSIIAATGFDKALAVAAPQGDQLQRVRDRLRQIVSFVFDIDEEVAPPDFLGTVQQALLLMNGSFVGSSTTAAPGSALRAVLDQSKEETPLADRERIAALYLRTLSRPPQPRESDYWVDFVHAPRDLVPEPGAKKPKAPPVDLGFPRRPPPPDPLRGLAGKLRPQTPTPRQQAFEDMLWALLNSSEFIFRH